MSSEEEIRSTLIDYYKQLMNKDDTKQADREKELKRLARKVYDEEKVLVTRLSHMKALVDINERFGFSGSVSFPETVKDSKKIRTLAETHAFTISDWVKDPIPKWVDLIEHCGHKSSRRVEGVIKGARYPRADSKKSKKETRKEARKEERKEKKKKITGSWKMKNNGLKLRKILWKEKRMAKEMSMDEEV